MRDYREDRARSLRQVRDQWISVKPLLRLGYRVESNADTGEIIARDKAGRVVRTNRRTFAQGAAVLRQQTGALNPVELRKLATAELRDADAASKRGNRADAALHRTRANHYTARAERLHNEVFGGPKPKPKKKRETVQDIVRKARMNKLRKVGGSV